MVQRIGKSERGDKTIDRYLDRGWRRCWKGRGSMFRVGDRESMYRSDSWPSSNQVGEKSERLYLKGPFSLSSTEVIISPRPQHKSAPLDYKDLSRPLCVL